MIASNSLNEFSITRMCILIILTLALAMIKPYKILSKKNKILPLFVHQNFVKWRYEKKRKEKLGRNTLKFISHHGARKRTI